MDKLKTSPCIFFKPCEEFVHLLDPYICDFPGCIQTQNSGEFLPSLFRDVDRFSQIFGVLRKVTEHPHHSKKIQCIGIAQENGFNASVRSPAVMQGDTFQDMVDENSREIPFLKEGSRNFC